MSENAQRVSLGPFFHDGRLQAAAKLYHYEAGTTTQKDLWADRAKSITLTQPLVADADGMFNFFADGNYKLVVTQPGSTGPSHLVLYTLDNWAFLDPTDIQLAKGTAINSSSTISVGPEIWAHVLGSVTIATLNGTIPFWWGVFDGNLTLTHSANLQLPGSRNRSIKTGDVCLFLNEGLGVWRLASHMEGGGGYLGRQGTSYAASAGLPIPADGDFADITGSDVDITSIATAHAGFKFTARFTGSGVQLVHHASLLICPYGRDYRIGTNELVEFRSLGSGNWIVSYRSGSSASPGSVVDLVAETADDGHVLPIGTALNCTRYMALAKRCIPAASVFGLTGTDLGTVTFANGSETWTLVAHGLANGDIVHLSNVGGILPTGYTSDTVYHVVQAATDTFKLSLTRGGDPVDGTTDGTGTHTVHNEFRVPDLRGRVVVTLDDLGGSNANVITSASTDGEKASILGGLFGRQTALTGSYNVGAGATWSSSVTQPSMALGSQLRW